MAAGARGERCRTRARVMGVVARDGRCPTRAQVIAAVARVGQELTRARVIATMPSVMILLLHSELFVPLSVENYEFINFKLSNA